MVGILLGVLAHQQILLMLRIDQILLLAVHLELSLVAIPGTHIASFGLLHILLCSSAIWSTVLCEAVAVSDSVVLSLREVVLAHHAWAQQAVQVVLIHTAHVWIHDAWIG